MEGAVAGRRGGCFWHCPGCNEAARVVDLKLLHAQIGELTLEKDFLSGALDKAGLLSAKRGSTVAMNVLC